MEIDFKRLSSEQDKILREILGICQYFQVSLAWNPPISDGVLAQRAREIGWKIAQLERVSAASAADSIFERHMLPVEDWH